MVNEELILSRDPRSEHLYRAIAKIDYEQFNDYFCFKAGGEGDNGEVLMDILDVYFRNYDKEYKKELKMHGLDEYV